MKHRYSFQNQSSIFKMLSMSKMLKVSLSHKIRVAVLTGVVIDACVTRFMTTELALAPFSRA